MNLISRVFLLFLFLGNLTLTFGIATVDYTSNSNQHVSSYTNNGDFKIHAPSQQESNLSVVFLSEEESETSNESTHTSGFIQKNKFHYIFEKYFSKYKNGIYSRFGKKALTSSIFLFVETFRI
jgi:hypothetical protein